MVLSKYRSHFRADVVLICALMAGYGALPTIPGGICLAAAFAFGLRWIRSHRGVLPPQLKHAGIAMVGSEFCGLLVRGSVPHTFPGFLLSLFAASLLLKCAHWSSVNLTRELARSAGSPARSD
jgi:hypothetical protein